ncbi:MAG: hexose kinase [Clostridia bacterium]|nr:hexose kinase [Clostridia bacterium]
MNVITLTLNPAFDLHCYADAFVPYHENVFDITAKDAGGKGINVSRALAKNGVKNLAVCVLGRENGGEFLKSLESEGLAVNAVYTEGRIRENITLHEKERAETRISFKGFSMCESALAKVREAMGTNLSGSAVVFAGSAPAGVSESALVAFLQDLKNAGASLVIDSRSLSIAAIAALRPMLIKPNKHEAEGALGIKIVNIEDGARAAKALREKGIENVLLSLGAEGAILSCPSGTYYASAPEIEVLSTVGAGDSTLAGFLFAKAAGCKDEEILARAVAFGSAACMLAGTAAPLTEDIEKLRKKISVKTV